MTPVQNKVFQLLCVAAEAGRPCPTNGELADQAQLLANNRASEIVGELERLGLIWVRRGSNSRVVTILATGATTSDHAGPSKPRRYEKSAGIDARLVQRPPDRTPCFRCGARGDLGCRHRRPASDQTSVAVRVAVPIERGRVAEAERERILRLASEGLNFTAIARIIARPRSTVWSILKSSQAA